MECFTSLIGSASDIANRCKIEFINFKRILGTVMNPAPQFLWWNSTLRGGSESWAWFELKTNPRARLQSVRSMRMVVPPWKGNSRREDISFLQVIWQDSSSPCVGRDGDHLKRCGWGTVWRRGSVSNPMSGPERSLAWDEESSHNVFYCVGCWFCMAVT